MTRSRLIQFLRTRSLLLSLAVVSPLLIVILGLAACVKHPVGDPENGKVDNRYAGVWLAKEAENEGSFLFMRPYDARTYFVNIFSYLSEGDGIKPTERLDCKAWLTSIAGATFITMEPLSCAHFAGLGEKPPYLVGKMFLADGALHLQLVNGDGEPARGAKNSREFEAAIAEHVDSEALYGDDIVFQKTEDKALIEAVLKAFHPEDGNE